MKKRLLLFALNIRMSRTLIILYLVGCQACFSQSHRPPEGFPKDLPDYRSQKQIRLQGFKIVPTPSGPRPSIYFGYDRNQDFQSYQSERSSTRRKRRSTPRKPHKTGIDLIEFKALRPEGGWQQTAFLIFSDDDFDGIADRIFIDIDGDGRLDEMRHIQEKSISMEKIDFNRIPF